VSPDVIEGAITEARRRQAISDRDVSGSVEHFARSVRPVCDKWRLTAEGWLDGGAGTPTLAVTTSDGTSGVLKIAEPGSLDVAARVMESADGRGYARVLSWDADHGALLTERLGAGLRAEAPTLSEQGPVIVSLLYDAWRVPLDRGEPFDGKAAGLLRILADLAPRYGARHPLAIATATRYAEELMRSERPEVVCHGDPHAGNVLRRGSDWALIDPDGFVGERSYDLGVVLRDASGEIAAADVSVPGSGAAMLWHECQRLAELSDVEPGRVWRWAFVERVTTGLYLRWHGYPGESSTFLDTAVMLAGYPARDGRRR
jgi:streptomycin 6-kinase